ncbi:MAG: hypothetical protein HQL05_14505 [Nitrospirae bacterium]|uniref:hypothetical protein n=1 Tax=Candidatus Magnetobacterium casense TaxID=1455061 RepID=UPI00058EBE97|nr:hypothetical protein [Candidatus Magnetobacterium casensis]MBF0339026.1 hypothetical protein [Nitrospirota bacterium]
MVSTTLGGNLDAEVIALNKDYGIKSDNVMWDFNIQTRTSNTGGTLRGSRMTLNGKLFFVEFTR